MGKLLLIVKKSGSMTFSFVHQCSTPKTISLAVCAPVEKSWTRHCMYVMFVTYTLPFWPNHSRIGCPMIWLLFSYYLLFLSSSTILHRTYFSRSARLARWTRIPWKKISTFFDAWSPWISTSYGTDVFAQRWGKSQRMLHLAFIRRPASIIWAFLKWHIWEAEIGKSWVLQVKSRRSQIRLKIGFYRCLS